MDLFRHYWQSVHETGSTSIAIGNVYGMSGSGNSGSLLSLALKTKLSDLGIPVYIDNTSGLMKDGLPFGAAQQQSYANVAELHAAVVSFFLLATQGAGDLFQISVWSGCTTANEFLTYIRNLPSAFQTTSWTTWIPLILQPKK